MVGAGDVVVAGDSRCWKVALLEGEVFQGFVYYGSVQGGLAALQLCAYGRRLEVRSHTQDFCARGLCVLVNNMDSSAISSIFDAPCTTPGELQGGHVPSLVTLSCSSYCAQTTCSFCEMTLCLLTVGSAQSRSAYSMIGSIRPPAALMLSVTSV